MLEAEVQMQVLKTQFVYSQAVMMGAQDEIPHFSKASNPRLGFWNNWFCSPLSSPVTLQCSLGHVAPPCVHVLCAIGYITKVMRATVADSIPVVDIWAGS